MDPTGSQKTPEMPFKVNMYLFPECNCSINTHTLEDFSHLGTKGGTRYMTVCMDIQLGWKESWAVIDRKKLIEHS